MGVICDFSGIYRTGIPEEIKDFIKMDLTGLEGTNGYCSEDAQREIRKIFSGYPAGEIHLTDNGNYHYVTKLWLEKLETAFDLVVFDHHTDMQPSALLPFLSCGNWIAESLEDPEIPLRKVWLIGPPEEALSGIGARYRERMTVVPEDQANAPERCVLPEEPEKVPVYLSIDKDVLSPEEMRVTWDQGSMRLETLAEWIGILTEGRKILGADLCGEPEEHTESTWNCNIKLIKLLKSIKNLTLQLPLR